MWPRRKAKPASEALVSARRQRRESERLLAEAKEIADDIRRIREKNHLAEALLAVLTGKEEE